MKIKIIKLILLFISIITTSQASVLEIIKLGDPILTKKINEEIAYPLSEEVIEFVESMKNTMLDEEMGGVGLAAPQVGENLRIIVYRIPENLPENLIDSEVPDGIHSTVMINPFYEPIIEEGIEEGWEGCLSLPGFIGKVSRFKAIKVKYQNLEGDIINKIARLFHARVIQHEIDHINPDGGIIYIQRMPIIEWGQNFGYTEEIKKFVIDQENSNNNTKERY